MTYIASPRTDLTNRERVHDCHQYVETAFNQLREISDESPSQQDDRLFDAGLAAGWEQTELRIALHNIGSGQPSAAQPDLAPEASSLSIQPVERTVP